MAFSALALGAVQVTLESVSNGGHFSLEVETVFRPYIHSHCSGMTEICYMALTTHALPAMEVRLK
jgi:hypothetical protein